MVGTQAFVVAAVVFLGLLIHRDGQGWDAAERTMAQLRPQFSLDAVGVWTDWWAWSVLGWAAVLVTLGVWPYLRMRKRAHVIAYALTATILGGLAGLTAAARSLFVQHDNVSDVYRLPSSEAFNALYFGSMPSWETPAYGLCSALLVIGSLAACVLTSNSAARTDRESTIAVVHGD